MATWGVTVLTQILNTVHCDIKNYNNINVSLNCWEVTGRCTNPRRQITCVNKFWMVAPNIGESSIRNFLHITLMVPRIMRLPIGFFFLICTLLNYCIILSHQTHLYALNVSSVWFCTVGEFIFYCMNVEEFWIVEDLISNSRHIKERENTREREY